MRISRISLLLSVALALSAPSSPAMAQSPSARAVFGEMRENLQAVVRSAEEAENRLIQKLAETALDTIVALEASAGELIDQSFNRLDATTRETFNEIASFADRVEEGQEILVADADRLSAQWMRGLRDIPGVTDRHEIYTHSPRVVAPSSSTGFLMKVIGPGIGAANPVATHAGDPLDLHAVSDSEINITVPRAPLDFGPDDFNVTSVRLTYDEKPAGTLVGRNPDRVTRDLPLWLLPTEVATWNLKQNLREEKVERTAVRTVVTASGRDVAAGPRAEVRPDHYAAGWRVDLERIGHLIDTRALQNGTRWFGTVATDAATCVGPNLQHADARRIEFVIQIGHNTDGWGNRQNGSGTCFVNLPLIRTTTANKVETAGDSLSWSEDRLVELASGTASWRLSLDLYDGRTVVVTSDTRVPRMDVEVEKAPDHIILRAHTPRNF